MGSPDGDPPGGTLDPRVNPRGYVIIFIIMINLNSKMCANVGFDIRRKDLLAQLGEHKLKTLPEAQRTQKLTP